jgi:hypothetical protein
MSDLEQPSSLHVRIDPDSPAVSVHSANGELVARFYGGRVTAIRRAAQLANADEMVARLSQCVEVFEFLGETDSPAARDVSAAILPSLAGVLFNIQMSEKVAG